jgi:hypothetical protein
MLIPFYNLLRRITGKFSVHPSLAHDGDSMDIFRIYPFLRMITRQEQLSAAQAPHLHTHHPKPTVRMYSISFGPKEHCSLRKGTTENFPGNHRGEVQRNACCCY